METNFYVSELSTGKYERNTKHAVMQTCSYIYGSYFSTVVTYFSPMLCFAKKKITHVLTSLEVGTWVKYHRWKDYFVYIIVSCMDLRESHGCGFTIVSWLCIALYVFGGLTMHFIIGVFMLLMCWWAVLTFGTSENLRHRVEESEVY